MKKSTNHFNQFPGQIAQTFDNEIILFPNTNILKTVLIAILMFTTSIAFSLNKNTDNTVLEAFELRIQGKPDQAKELLLTILERDSTNAAAHFEVARTLNYMNLRGSKKADRALKNALKYDPENIVYAYYNAKNCFLKAYIAMHTEEGSVKDLVNLSCHEFVKVLKMKPDYPEALMYLVEIYGMLPVEIGGDKIKAEEFAQKLEKLDKFYGAKARLVLMPEGTDRIEYWNNFIVKNGEDCKALKELGVASLFNEDIDAAKVSFTKAIALDDTQNIRLIDLSRFHMMKVMQNRDAAEEELPKSKEYIEQYLASTPEPIPPLKAYAMGKLVKIEMISGNKSEADKLMEEAKLLDPYFSRAFGIPSMAIFEPPYEIDHHFTSFFSPY
jgi:tetratricopeptide (TPR) repeat protein